MDPGQQRPPQDTDMLLDADADYCKTYAILVDELRQLLDKMDQEGPNADLRLELQNQTRAAVSVTALLCHLLH